MELTHVEYSALVEGIRQLNRDIYATMDAPGAFATAESAAKILLKVRDAVEALEEVMKMSRSLHKLLKEARVPDAFETTGVQNISLLGYRFSRTQSWRASYREGMKVDAIQWLRGNDLGDIVIDFVPPMTLAATAKALSEENQSLPDDYFTTHIQQGMSITKVKP